MVRLQLRTVVTFAILCSHVAPVQAQNFDEGIAAFHAGNFATALSQWCPLAKQGHARAQYGLGIMYEYGRGLGQNDVEALKWYRKAAEQGHALAQHDLAFMYVAGTGVPQDYVRAYMWLKIAVVQGNNLMVNHLNRIAKDLTVTQVGEAHDLARKWMRKHQQ